MQRLYTTQFNAINSLYWLKNKCGGLEATLYALREDHVRAPLSQQKSSALPRLPPPPGIVILIRLLRFY